MVHHDAEIFACGQFDELLGLRGVAGERLFDEDMLAILKSSLGQLVVGPDRRDDGDHIDLRRSDEFTSIGRSVNTGISLLRACPGGGTNFADGRYLGAIDCHDVSYDIGSPVTITNYTEFHRIHRFF